MTKLRASVTGLFGAMTLFASLSVLAGPPISVPGEAAAPPPAETPKPAVSSSANHGLATFLDWRKPDDGAYRVTSADGAWLIRAQCAAGGYIVVPNRSGATPAARDADLRAACKRSNFGTMDDNSTH